MNKEFINNYKTDIFRYNQQCSLYLRGFHYLFRKCQASKNPITKYIYRFLFSICKKHHGIELYYNTQIGKGLYLGHPYNITINSGAKIGKYCNLHKGVTIGNENRGKRKGSPTIGNKVWIGINSTIVGRISIGDDVLIAPNCFVNFDVPSHSIVIGNPGRIIHNEKATLGYIENILNETI